ncbi:MAG: OmpA family protein [Sandaracinaceae bacterium]
MKRSSALSWALCLLVFVLPLGACGRSEDEYQLQVRRVAELEQQLADSQRQRRELEGRLSDLDTRNQELISRLEALGQDVESLRSERTSLTTSLTETQRALDELRAREAAQQARLATFRQMLERFRAMMESGRLRVRVVRGRMVVELPDNVLFDSGAAELKPEGQATLIEVVGILRTIEGRHFQVAGHTDNVPIRSRRFPSNWELSSARAVTVTRFMIEQGMPPDRIAAVGYADTQPVDTNDTEEGRARNRRIEIALMPNLDELPDLSSLSAP